MCGIAGYVLARGAEPTAERLVAMLRTLERRGPDDEGLALVARPGAPAQRYRTDHTDRGVTHGAMIDPRESAPHGIGLGQRRFSIIDLSPGGHQPFWSEDGRVCVTFNGEIYNYVEVRDDLVRLGRRFRTDSDTEVLVEAYRAWGVKCFERLNGFWALALYDADQGRVLLARDRIGKAPLYVARRPDGVWWCSEIKGLLAALGRGAFRVRDQAVDDFVRHLWRDLFDGTFYEGIETFPCASWAWIEPDGSFTPTSYWSLPSQRLTERQISIPEAAERYRAVLQDSVRIRLRADVPVGLELSGGLDSSSIVAMAAALRSGQKLHAYSVSYPDSVYDELPFAKSVVARYADQIEHHVLTPENDSILGDLDWFVQHMDEPYHDPVLHSQVAIWRRMRGMGIRVALNGGGGDEVLAGYGVDYFDPYLLHLLARGRLLRFGKEYLRYTESRSAMDHVRRAYHLLPSWMRLYHNPAMDIPPEFEPYRPGGAVVRRAGAAKDVEGLLRDYMTHWRMNYWVRAGNMVSMALPIEYRCSLLDHRMVELGFSLPLGYLIRDGWLKWIARKAVEDHLPADVVWRRQKAGFRYPLSERLPACRDEVFEILEGVDCPYVDMAKLRAGYLEINRRNPTYLWRLLSVAFWWKRCVEGESLVPRRLQAAASAPA
jgi:asparagine synthase (glutamine-hydrolysing)